MNKVIISLVEGIKPRWAGVYPTMLPGIVPPDGFSHFDGEKWSGQMGSIPGAIDEIGTNSSPDKHIHLVLEDAQETPWMPPTEKPNVPGVYKTQLLEWDEGAVVVEGWSHWDGKTWTNTMPEGLDAALADRKKNPEGSPYHNKPWKGLYDATKYEVK